MHTRCHAPHKLNHMSLTTGAPGRHAHGMTDEAPPIHLDRANGQFFIDVDARRAVLEFRLRGRVLSVLHTETPPELRGRGFANALARAALEWARAEGFTVKPYCPFTAGFIRRHPEFESLVDSEFTMPTVS